MKCSYGCGRETNHQLKNGKWCCNSYPSKCSAIKNKIRDTVTSLHNDPSSIYNVSKDEIKEKQSKSQKIAWTKDTHKCKTQETKKKQRDINLKNRNLGVYNTKEYREKLSKRHKEIWEDPESSYNSIERKNKISKSIKKLYNDKTYLNKLQKGLKVKPNKAEKNVIKILKDMGVHNFQFVGDFSKWIGGKNPDFVNENDGKIIELFGDYWHSEEKTGMCIKKHENARKSHFKKFGYKTLIVWESELKDRNKLKDKIYRFVEG